MADEMDEPPKKFGRACLLGVPREIRLNLYEFLLKRNEPIDTVLTKAKARTIMRNGLLAKQTQGQKYVKTLAKVEDELYGWNEKTVFLVCRMISAEATAFYYNRNIFECYSPEQCVDWLLSLTRRTASMIRHISVPVLKMPFYSVPRANQPALDNLPIVAPGLWTLRLSKVIQLSDDPNNSNVRSWPMGVQDPGCWDKWIIRWASDIDKDGEPLEGDNVNDPAVSFGGPYRAIFAARDYEDLEEETEEESEEEEEQGSKLLFPSAWCECHYCELGEAYVVRLLARMRNLTTVYLGDGVPTCWEAAIAVVLAKLEQQREDRRRNLGLVCPK